MQARSVSSGAAGSRPWTSCKASPLAQLAPGPLAAQLAIYLGWVRGRLLGATVVAFAFILPSFVMVLALAAAYVKLGGLPWMQACSTGSVRR